MREKLVTPREAAQLLGVSYPTVKQWIYKKKLRTIKTADGHHRLPESQLDKFLRLAFQRGDVGQRRVTSNAPSAIGLRYSLDCDGLEPKRGGHLRAGKSINAFHMISWVLLVSALSGTAAGQQLRVVAAANLQFVFQDVSARFQNETGHTVELTFGSSANFFLQIQNGAPFDMFLSQSLKRRE